MEGELGRERWGGREGEKRIPNIGLGKERRSEGEEEMSKY